MEKVQELENCGFCKAILMFAVVACHSLSFWTGKWFTALTPYEQSQSMGMFAEWLGTFHVQTFTLISGYIFYYVKFELKGYKNLMGFLSKKVFRLIVPYVFVSFLWVIPLSQLFFKFSASDIFIKFVLGASPSQLWFLLMLFVVFLIAYIMSPLLDNHENLFIAIVIVLYFLGWILPFNIFQISTAFRFLVFFVVGMMIRKCYVGILEKASLGGAFLVINVITFLLDYYMPEGSSGIISHFALYTIYSLSGAIMAFVFLQKIASFLIWNKGIFRYFVKQSYPIYLLHQQIIYICIFCFNALLSPYLIAFVSFVVSVLLSIIISEILLINKYSCRILGFAK